MPPEEHNPRGKEPLRKRKKQAPVPESVLGLKQAFASSLKRAGIRDFKFHDLCRTLASQMIMRGASHKEVQEILVHKTMTLRYAHPGQAKQRRSIS